MNFRLKLFAATGLLLGSLGTPSAAVVLQPDTRIRVTSPARVQVMSEGEGVPVSASAVLTRRGSIPGIEVQTPAEFSISADAPVRLTLRSLARGTDIQAVVPRGDTSAEMVRAAGPTIVIVQTGGDDGPHIEASRLERVKRPR